MKPENVKCPDCGGPMLRRTAKKDGRKFWGCQKFPTCRGTRDTDGEARGQRRGKDYGDAGDAGDRLPSERATEADRGRWRQ